MKHVCVAARIGDGKAPGEGNSCSIAKTSNEASRGGRSRFQALYAWMRPCSATFSASNPRALYTPPRSHPRKRGASEGGRGLPLGSDPADAQRDRRVRAHDRLHRRIPASGAPAPRFAEPCSALRRSLLHAPVRRRFWLQPFGLARVLAHGVVVSPLLRMTKPQDFLLALSQNRDSASRVSSCCGLLC